MSYRMPFHTTWEAPKPGMNVDRVMRDLAFEARLKRDWALKAQYPPTSPSRWADPSYQPAPMKLCESCGKRPLYAKGLCHYEYNRVYYQRYLARHQTV